MSISGVDLGDKNREVLQKLCGPIFQNMSKDDIVFGLADIEGGGLVGR